jgi:hypothetical protein
MREWRALASDKSSKRFGGQNKNAIRDIPKWGEHPKGETMTHKMKISLFLLAGVLALVPMLAAQSSVRADANTVSIKGRVSCSKFGTGTVSASKGRSIAQIIQYCVNFQNGVYTVVSGNHIYGLAGDTKLLAKMSGQTVTVAGRVVPESTDVATYAYMGTVAVTEVVPAKE